VKGSFRCRCRMRASGHKRTFILAWVESKIFLSQYLSNENTMPYILTWEFPNTMWCQFSGDVDAASINKATNDFYNDERSDHVTQVIWDFSAMKQFRVEENQVTEIAFTDHAASGYMKPMKAAFIITNPKFSELAKHYIAMMEQLESAWTNRLFASIEDAKVWIACP